MSKSFPPPNDEKAMTEKKRQSPNVIADEQARRQPPPEPNPRDIKHDDSGVAGGRRTEDDQIDEPVERDGWNSNT